MKYAPFGGAAIHVPRRLAAGAAVTAVAAAGVLVATAASALTPSPCTYAYTIVAQWPGGFQAEVAVTSNTRVSNPTVAWTFAGDERITAGWNGIFRQSGQHVTVTSPAWQSVIEAGRTVRPGFVASVTGPPPLRLASVSLNGLTCYLPGTAPTATATSGQPTSSATPTGGVIPTPTIPITNPYAGAAGYRNPAFAARVAESAATRTGDVAAAMRRVGLQPTGLWLGSIAAVASLRDHLDQALAQPGPVVVTLILDNLPNRDCDKLVPYGELTVADNGLARYRTEYVDAITAVLRDPAYASLRVAAIVEPGAVGSLVGSFSGTVSDPEECAEIKSSQVYTDGIRYALDALAPIANVWTYLDASPTYQLGYELGPAARFYASLAAGTRAGLASIDGFATNVAGYSPIVEPYLPDVDLMISGQPLFQSRWVDWSHVIDEEDYVAGLHAALVDAGFPAGTGIVIDTSRNGWGGPNRPTAVSTSATVDAYVNESRVDRRVYRHNWCNQVGAGIGERPRANPMPHVDAFIWAWEPGASDGPAPAAAGQPTPVGADPMCNPAWSWGGGDHPTGASYGAPAEGAWFDAHFATLVGNAYPAL